MRKILLLLLLSSLFNFSNFVYAENISGFGGHFSDYLQNVLELDELSSRRAVDADADGVADQYDYDPADPDNGFIYEIHNFNTR